jgi:hypothetical protein
MPGCYGAVRINNTGFALASLIKGCIFINRHKEPTQYVMLLETYQN